MVRCMENLKNELKKLLEEKGMNEHTIIGVLELADTEEIVKKTLKYVKENWDILTDHQMRQYMTFLILLGEEV